ncbi:MAG TPA: HAMP domain-containing sensor histidine kinase [Thermoanaerobaculia bacterium]|nr:HAMP domain-containing sensor histidine kinase [Thermoanaerobaculia bacterium]
MQNRTLAILLVLLAVALAALAVLQYRWIDRTTEAERVTRKGHAEFVARRIADGLRREIQRTFDAFLGPEDEPVEAMYDRWRHDTGSPELVEAVYIAHRNDYEDESWSLTRLDLRTNAIESAQWTPRLDSMRALLSRVDLHDERRPVPLQPSVPALFVIHGPRRDFGIFSDGASRVVFVMLSRDALRKIMAKLWKDETPALYDVSLVDSDRVLFSSSAAWPGAKREADATEIVSPALMARRPRPPREVQEANPSWFVLVRHHGGGVDALMASTREQNLAVSGAILLILAAAVVMLVVLMRRVERLRAQESSFVRVMTHELNTPVAVLRSAGENLKDGIVEPDQVALYGATVVEEADNLRLMIGEVLALARLRSREGGHDRRAMEIRPIVESVVERCRMIAGEKVTIETDFEENLPFVAADEQWLTRAVQNLVMNAIRHGGSGEWVGVHVRRARDRVCITVEDRGPGISAEDARQLFDPFFRGKGSERVSGAGLGLAIVREIAAQHGGSVVLEKRDVGAAFTIQLPAVMRA